jgi:ketosteroid isomerase-like protein
MDTLTPTHPAASGTDSPAARAQVLQHLYEAVGAGDAATAAALMDPEVVFHVPGTGLNAGDHRGIDAVLGFLAAAAEATGGTLTTELHEVLGGERHAVALATYRARRPGRAPLANDLAHVVTFRGGRVAESWFHSRNQYEVDAFWSEG